MAPRKRSRADEDVDGDVEIEVESASSSFQQTFGNKRSRISLAAERAGSILSTAEDDYDDLLAGSSARGGAADLSSDNESESGSVDELQATQIVKAQMQKTGENMASEQGVIIEIHIRNFMCHSNVRVPLGPLINFITGANGSGKSAILTALQVCLGTKAKSTNRAPNLPSMVKTGEESAFLAVKIKNEGEDAFKPNIYGASILVERHFTRSGTSSFKIKNDQGKIITTKKKDLDEITESFGLQLDNPINVLTQDRAREFLSNSTPAEKYKFFIQGTQLQALDGDYNLMEEKLDMIEEVVKLAAGDLDIFKQKAVEAEQKKKRLDRAAVMQEKMRDVERQHAWCQVEEQERILEQFQEDVRTHEELIQERRDAAKEAGNAYEAHNTAFESAKRAIEELKESGQPKEAEQQAAKEKFDANKEALLKAQSEKRNIKSEWDAAKKSVVRLGKDIAEEVERMSGAAGDAHEARLQELEDLKAAAEDAKKAYADHQLTLGEREKDKADAEQVLKEFIPKVDAAKEELRVAQNALSSTQRDQGNPLSGYDRRMQDLLRMIHKETRWRTTPVGPMGRHVRITEPEWTSVLEKTFGQVLNSFVVTHPDDSDILNKMIKALNIRDVSVFISRTRDPLSTEGKEPDPQLSTIYRILRIDSVPVCNTLIINQAIEQIVLAKDRAAGELIMFPRNGSRPNNVRAVLAHATAANHGFRFDATRTGGKRTNPIPAWSGNYRMKTDREKQMRIQETVRNDAKRGEDAAVLEQKRLEREVAKASQALELHKRQSRTLRTEAQKAEDRVDAKQTEIDSNKPQTGRLEQLRTELADAEKDVANAYGALEDSVKATAVLDEANKELKKVMDEAQRSLDILNGRILREEERVQRCETLRREALLEKNAAEDNVTQATMHLERLQGKVTAQEANLEIYLTGASEVCARVQVEPGVSVDELNDRIKKLEERYRREEQEAGGSMEELTAEHRRAQKEFEDAKKALRSQQSTAKNLKEARRERRRRWGLFRKYITARARSNFQYLLSERQFRGRVLMNHQDKTLNISVEPDVTRTSDSGRQANTLSGGEKSFSQICLLLSIWEAMGSPIRCLDEFDVFMDNVNRDMSIEIMVEAARRSVGRQFILITPNSMDRVPDAGDVRKFKMPDPNRGRERGQLPLPGAS